MTTGPDMQLAAEAASDPRLLLRRGIYMPILYLCCGSSIFEEVTYRGILLHALVTKLRLPPLVATEEEVDAAVGIIAKAMSVLDK